MENNNLIKVPTDLLDFSGRNPRDEIRNIEELAENVAQYGILEPIIVRPKNSRFEVVVGERRVKAAAIAGLNEIPALVRTISDLEADELRFIENIHREDLTDAEKGDAILSLCDNYPDEFPTFKAVADKLKLSYKSVKDVWVSKARKISPFLRQCLFEQALGENQIHHLMKYDHATQDLLASKIAAHKLKNTPTIKFLKLYDENPDTNLDDLAEEAKGIKQVRLIVDELPPETAEKVSEFIKQKEEQKPPVSEEIKAKAAKSLRETIERKKNAREKFEAQQEMIVTDPKEIFNAKVEGIGNKLTQIENPRLKTRMTKEAIKVIDELDKLDKRVDRAPERRQKVQDKLMRLRELEGEGVYLGTLWTIEERKDYAGKKVHGNCPPQVVEQCVLRLSKRNDLILDPMAGSGTCLDVCDILDRRSIGYDIKPLEDRKDIIQNDSRSLPLPNEHVDLIFLHPPYWDMVYFTDAKEGLADLSRAPTIEVFLDMLGQVLHECYRVLKSGRYICVLLGDRIKEGKFIPLCRKTANLMEEIGFTDCGYAVKFTQGATSLMVKGKMIYAELAYTENLKPEHDLAMFFKKEV